MVDEKPETVRQVVGFKRGEYFRGESVEAVDFVGVLLAVYFFDAVLGHRSFSNLKALRTAEVARASRVVWISRSPLALILKFSL
jgi:hypothetical protein